jgi:hypothetical protein
MIASMRNWPKAPRDCLLARTPCSEVTSLASAVMFFCALSITASRSCSFCKLSAVCWVVFCNESPSRCETESSRSLTACCTCDWRSASILIIASRRAAASRWACSNSASGSVVDVARLRDRQSVMPNAARAVTATLAIAATVRIGRLSVTLANRLPVIRVRSAVRGDESRAERRANGHIPLPPNAQLEPVH